MIKRIIYLIEIPFGQWYYDLIGIDILKKNGFEVEVWNFTPFLHPQINKEVKVPDPINWEKHYSFLNLNEALSAILKLTNDCFIVCMVSYHLKSFDIYWALSKMKMPYCIILSNSLPLINNKQQMYNIFKDLKKITSARIFNALFTRIPFQYLGIRPATLILAGGAMSIDFNYRYPVSKKTEILWLHTTDYDKYLKERSTPVQSNTNMGVFLDEYLPFHPDLIHLGLSSPCIAEEYYPLLCELFDLIECECNVHVVIAAHPKSNYEDHPDYFGGRPVIRGKTVELVRKSGFAIGHSSASLNFAVLFHKPIIFLTSNSLKQSAMGPHIDLMASWLGKKAINIDNPTTINWKKELSIDEKAYKNYMHSYIKKAGSEELPFWQIFANRIKKYNEL